MTLNKLPPGPRFAPLQTLRFALDMHGLARDCARRYGDPFSVPTVFGTMVMTGHPEGIREIFTADPDTFEAFGSGPLEPLVGSRSMLLLSGARHKRERKLLMPPFHGERMRAYGELMQTTTLEAAARLQPGARVVMQEVTQSVTLNIILRAVFGVQEPERIARFHRLNDDALAAFKPAYVFFPALRQGFLPGWRRLVEGRRAINDFLQEQVDRCRLRTGEHEDIISLMLSARDEAGQPMTEEELKDELITMVAAGHETTALSLAWALFWVHRDPSVARRLFAELATLGPTPPPDALARLPYLGAVCDETLRRSPVVAIAPRRTVRPLRLRGWDIPVGTGVAAVMVLAHTDPSLYPDPQAFRPERFLERKYSPFEFLPFGGGARRCLGAAFAAYEMRIVLGSLLARHRFSLVSSEEPRTIRRNVTMGPLGGIPMIYEGERGAASAADPAIGQAANA